MHEKNNNHSSVEWAISTFIAFTQLDWIGNKESKLLSGTVIRCPAFQYSPTRPTVGQLNTGITLLLGLIANCVPLVSNISGSRESLKIMSRNEKKRPHLERGKKKKAKIVVILVSILRFESLLIMAPLRMLYNSLFSTTSCSLNCRLLLSSSPGCCLALCVCVFFTSHVLTVFFIIIPFSSLNFYDGPRQSFIITEAISP